jgi:hypothetical protein
MVAESGQQCWTPSTKKVAQTLPAIVDVSDEHAAKMWTLRMAGKTIFTMPRARAIREMFMNHVAHHPRATFGLVALAGRYRRRRFTDPARIPKTSAPEEAWASRN